MLKNFDFKTFYHAKLDENLCNKSFSYLETFFPKFKSKDWECFIRTSNNITDNILNAPKLHEFKMNIVSHIENYFHLKGLFIEGYISSSWVNIYEENFFQEFHIHRDERTCNIQTSGVVYLTLDNSEIEFWKNTRFSIKPEFTDILIFPDDLQHRVKPNKNKELRVSLAFNYTHVRPWSNTLLI